MTSAFVPTPDSITDWMRLVGELKPDQTWVVARSTPRTRGTYGGDALFLSRARYAALTERHRVALRDDALIEIANRAEAAFGTKTTAAFATALVEAFEAGRRAP